MGDSVKEAAEPPPHGGKEHQETPEIPTGQRPLSWRARIDIAFGTAKGLEYLHDRTNPPVIYRDLKPSNILLSDGFRPKLSDGGIARLGPAAEDVQFSSRVMGTNGYCAPEYASTGHLTLESDVYSFGVFMLELITGRRILDTTRPTDEQNLVAWAQQVLKEKKRFPELADPLLQGEYPASDLNHAVVFTALCLQEEPSLRPMMADAVAVLNFLAMNAEIAEARSATSTLL